MITINKLRIMGLLMVANGLVYADNPIIPNQGVCDPHIRIFNNKAYLYSSHDFGTGQPIYKMTDWQLFSSSDLVTWKKEFVLRPEDTYIGPWNGCYAPDGIERNGKYYFYFSQQQSQTGVAVADKPEGPYVDALGKPMLPASLTPTADYDIGVFIDDDPERTPYMIWGYTVAEKDYYMARLNEDMISLAEAPRKVVIHKGWKNDAPAIHKHNGLYYLNSHGGKYATSTNVYGPYTYRGTYTKEWTDHGSFFDWNNQTFHTYGDREKREDPFYRTTKITYAYYKDNGDIVTDSFIGNSPLGVGQYDADWSKTEAEWYFAASDGMSTREGASRFEMRNINDGASLFYPKFRNIPANATITFQVSSANPAGGTIEVRENSATGPLLGSCRIPATGGWSTYQPVSMTLKNQAGTKDLYLIFKGKDAGAELMRLDWFRFGVYKTYEAEQGMLSGGCKVNKNHPGYSGTGFVDGFVSAGATAAIDIDAATAGSRYVSLRYSCGAGSRTLDLYVNGEMIKPISFPATADWASWSSLNEELSLKAGKNTLVFKTEKGVPINMDYIEVHLD